MTRRPVSSEIILKKLASYLFHILHILFFLSLGYIIHLGVEWYFYGDTITEFITGVIISVFGLGSMIYFYRRGLERIQSFWEEVKEGIDGENLAEFLYSKLKEFTNKATNDIDGLSFKLLLLLIILKAGQYIEVYLPLNPVEQFIQAFISLIYLVILILIVLPYTK